MMCAICRSLRSAEFIRSDSCETWFSVLTKCVVGTFVADIVQSFDHDARDRYNGTGTQRVWMALTMLRWPTAFERGDRVKQGT
jgi:hypothetical protein